MFSVFRNWAVVFQTCCIIFHFHQQCNDPVSPCTSIWCHFFSRSHSVMFDTSILWYFAAVLTCISLVTLNIFSLASLPLCTFFSKISVYIFSPFSNFNACFVYGIVVFILKRYYRSENPTENVHSQVHRKFNAYNRPLKKQMHILHIYPSQ